MWMGWSQVGKIHGCVASLPSLCVLPTLIARSNRMKQHPELPLDKWGSVLSCSVRQKSYRVCASCSLSSARLQVSFCSDSPQPPVLDSSRFPRKKANSWGKGHWGGNCSSPWEPWETVKGKFNLRKAEVCSWENCKHSSLGHITTHLLWKT